MYYINLIKINILLLIGKNYLNSKVIIPFIPMCYTYKHIMGNTSNFEMDI